jgi:hypothetical protein
MIRQCSAETRGTVVDFSDKISDMLFILHNFVIQNAKNKNSVIYNRPLSQNSGEDFIICSNNNFAELRYERAYDLYTQLQLQLQLQLLHFHCIIRTCYRECSKLVNVDK